MPVMPIFTCYSGLSLASQSVYKTVHLKSSSLVILGKSNWSLPVQKAVCKCITDILYIKECSLTLCLQSVSPSAKAKHWQKEWHTQSKIKLALLMTVHVSPPENHKRNAVKWILGCRRQTNPLNCFICWKSYTYTYGLVGDSFLWRKCSWLTTHLEGLFATYFPSGIGGHAGNQWSGPGEWLQLQLLFLFLDPVLIRSELLCPHMGSVQALSVVVHILPEQGCHQNTTLRTPESPVIYPLSQQSTKLQSIFPSRSNYK